MPSKRIAEKFAALKKENRAAFIPFIMAGDPNAETSLEIAKGLPAAGADLIELGVCFTDPMADGPSIEAAGLRALKAGQTLAKTIGLARAFRSHDADTPLILMGYYNPFRRYGLEAFAQDAASAGVDGVIIVDLPPEEDAKMREALDTSGIDFVRLATPTTDDDRLARVVDGASGFVYYVSVAGVTGAKSGDASDVAAAVGRVREASGLPVAVGFGVKTTQRAAEIAQIADGVVVGSAIVEKIAGKIDLSSANQPNGGANEEGADREIVNEALSFARDIAMAVRGASR
ncbi:MAG: tryptophan synthase subunit alpha [Pseudomonadota bacterium]